MSATISSDDFALVLSGWKEDRRRLRVVLRAMPVSFGAFGLLFFVSDTGDFTLSLEGKEADGITVSVAGCKFGYLDAPGDIAAGASIESGLVAVRDGFNLAVMLLAE